MDGALALSVSFYTVRLNYLSFLALTFFLVFGEVRRTSLKDTLRGFESKIFAGLVLMGVSGFLGTLHSANPKRSFFFLIWTLGTLGALPFVYRLLLRVWGEWVHRIFSIYVALMGMIPILDGIICYLPGKPSIGRVILTVDFAGCRPFGFYQEPNYLAAFNLFAASALILAYSVEKNSRWKKAVAFSIAVAYAAVIFSTSKMGIAAVAIISGVSVLHLLLKVKSIRFTRKQILGYSIGALAAASALSLAFFMNGFLFESLKVSANIANQTGTDFRYKNAITVLDLLKSYPLVGVGPSGTGAFVAKNLGVLPRAQEFVKLKNPPDLKAMANDPFFYNLYSEVIGEWGLFGFLGLMVLLYGYFRHLRNFPLLIFSISFLFVSSSWQTLPRFDLWTCLALATGWLAQSETRAKI